MITCGMTGRVPICFIMSVKFNPLGPNNTVFVQQIKTHKVNTQWNERDREARKSVVFHDQGLKINSFMTVKHRRRKRGAEGGGQPPPQ